MAYWIKKQDGVECSECGFRRITGLTYNYCPTCGAEMKHYKNNIMSRSDIIKCVEGLSLYYYNRLPKVEDLAELNRVQGASEATDSILMLLKGQEEMRKFISERGKHRDDRREQLGQDMQ